jgi:hypothetical protein
MRRTSGKYALKRLLTKQWRQIAPNYLVDYYPLLGYSAEEDAWMVWQFVAFAGAGIEPLRSQPRTAHSGKK